MAGIRHNRTYIATMQISFPTISGNRVRNFAVQLAGLPNASVEERVLATVNAAMRNHNMLGITEINDPFPEYADSVCHFSHLSRFSVTYQLTGINELQRHPPRFGRNVR